MKQRIEYLAVRALIASVRLLNPSHVRQTGTLLGNLFYRLDSRHRQVAEANVAAAFRERSERERQSIVRGAFAHFGHLFMALLEFSSLTPEEMLARVEFQGDDHVRAAFARGKGVIFVTGHFGFWELQALVHALRLPPMSVVARTLDNPALNDLLERMRTRTGNSVIYRQGTLRRMLRTLQSGGAVGILIDQHIITSDAIQVKFFGRPAATTAAVAALAQRTGAAVIPLFALPLDGGRYRMVYEPPVDAPPPGPDSIAEFTQRCTDVLERYVRGNPELWLWMHRRWR